MIKQLFPAAILTTVCFASSLSIANDNDAFTVCPAKENSQERLACFDEYTRLRANSSALQVSAPESNVLDIGNRILSTADAVAAGYSGADIAGLSSYEQNRVLFRRDETELHEAYMDADLSIKYPFLTGPLEAAFSKVNFGHEDVVPRLYFAFSTRFSQYIKTRKSSPVVPRRYNPELFLRLWKGNGDFFDIGYGHESNGQSISEADDFITAQEKFEKPNNDELADMDKFIENPLFARDELSRGWDYFSFKWRKQWESNLFRNTDGRIESKIEFKRFLSDGFLQGPPEEYNIWEDDGFRLRPRDEYDGLNYSLQYILPTSSCRFAICLTKIEIDQATGYQDIFKHNSTELQLTINIGDTPFHVWTKSGYNNDLVDYYDYTNSWGVGFEFSP